MRCWNCVEIPFRWTEFLHHIGSSYDILQEVSATREAVKLASSRPWIQPTMCVASQYQKNEPRLVPYKIRRRAHHDAIYYFDLKLARDRGLMFCQTQSHGIILSTHSVPADTLVQVVKIKKMQGDNFHSKTRIILKVLLVLCV